jgi:hypothetical protein
VKQAIRNESLRIITNDNEGKASVVEQSKYSRESGTGVNMLSFVNAHSKNALLSSVCCRASHRIITNACLSKKKSTAIPVTGREGLYGCEMLRIPHCLDNRLTVNCEILTGYL